MKPTQTLGLILWRTASSSWPAISSSSPSAFSAHHRPRARSRSHPWFLPVPLFVLVSVVSGHGRGRRIAGVRDRGENRVPEATSPPGPRNRAMTAKQIARSLLLANTGFRHRPLRCDVVGSLQTGGSTPCPNAARRLLPSPRPPPAGGSARNRSCGTCTPRPQPRSPMKFGLAGFPGSGKTTLFTP